MDKTFEKKVYYNVGCSARLKTSFELNPVTEGKQETLPYLMILYC